MVSIRQLKMTLMSRMAFLAPRGTPQSWATISDTRRRAAGPHGSFMEPGATTTFNYIDFSNRARDRSFTFRYDQNMQLIWVP